MFRERGEIKHPVCFLCLSVLYIILSSFPLLHLSFCFPFLSFYSVPLFVHYIASFSFYISSLSPFHSFTIPFNLSLYFPFFIHPSNSIPGACASGYSKPKSSSVCGTANRLHLYVYACVYLDFSPHCKW